MSKFVKAHNTKSKILGTGRKSSNDVTSRRDFSRAIGIKGRTAHRAIIVKLGWIETPGF
jgi:hypothetical protein